MSNERVIIIGGGITGLTTALALRDLFDELVVVERDSYPEDSSERRYTPQGHHVHVLLARGLEELVALVPELPGWLDEAGLPEGDLTGDVWVAQGGKWLPRRRCGVAIRPCARPVLEHYLRRAIMTHDNIELRTGVRVESLIGDARVEGVVMLDADDQAHELRGELVVDACGRNTKTVRWLEQGGHGEVETSIVDAKVTYASCSFEPKPDVELPCAMMAVTGAVGIDPRFGAIMPGGHGRWLAAMINYVGSPPPMSVAEFIEQSAALAVPDIHELLQQATPCSEVRRFANTANRRHHLGRLRSWPDRYAVVGDAACTLNPRYGQGMTVAAVGARLLAETIARARARATGLDGATARYQRELERMLDTPWQLATAEDQTWLILQRGSPTLSERLTLAAAQRLVETMASDYEAYVSINRVAHMIDPMSKLASPRMLGKLLFPRLRSLE